VSAPAVPPRALRSPLARRLIIGIVVVSSLITLLLTAAQLYDEYHSEMRGIREVFRQIEDEHLAALSQSLWVTSANDLRLQLEGIVRVPNIEYAGVREGNTLWAEAGRRASQHVIERQYRLAHEHHGTDLEIGTLTVVAGLDGIYRDLLRQGLIILAANAFKTFLVATFAFLFFQRLVNRHLAAIAAYVRGLDVREASAALKLERVPMRRPDELEELAGAINDLRERVRVTVATLRDTDAFLRLTLNGAQAGTWDRDLVGQTVYFSPEYLRLIGCEVGELPGLLEDWESRLHPADHDAAVARFKACVEGRTSNYESEYRLRYKDGSYRWFLSRGSSLRDETGRPVRLLGVLIEITARKEAEQAQRESEARARSILDTMFSFVGLITTDGVLIEVNRAALEAAALTRVQVVGQPVIETFWLSHSATVQAQVSDALRRAATGETVREEVIVRVVEGRLITLDVAFSPLRDAAGRTVQIVASGVDITERKRAEEEHERLEVQLRQAQKMEALGTLAGGIAHDFNNILGAIIGNVALAREDMALGHEAAVLAREDIALGRESVAPAHAVNRPHHPIEQSLAEIAKAAARARDLVQQILTFSRQQPQERRVIALADVIAESVRLMRATLPAGIELATTLSPDVPNVLADRTQIHQVIMNLCTNAWQAMSSRAGRIELGLQDVTVQDGASETHLRPGRYACLSVTDNGKGMDAATLERIFDPFFTTKALGEGTGLGLAVVDGIVKAHHGGITVSSQPGQGTSFRLYFPAASAPAHEAPAASASLPRGGGQRILYLDDEEPLVLLTQRLLGRLGYSVTGFSRSDEALAAFHADPHAWDVFVTDLNMPGPSGLDVAAEVLRTRSDLPVALASGYLTETLHAQALALGVREVIYKPNTADELAQVIARMVVAAHVPARAADAN
jgi:PAS domain S-box-containing protein